MTVPVLGRAHSRATRTDGAAVTAHDDRLLLNDAVLALTTGAIL